MNDFKNIIEHVKKDVVCISRKRNKTTNKLVEVLSSVDYNYDYRGANPVLNLIKAAITSSEIPKAKLYLAEGILCAYVGVFLKIRHKDCRLICYLNGPDFYLNQQDKGVKKYIFWILKKIMMSKVDHFMCISDKVVCDLHSTILDARYTKVGCFSENLDVALSQKFHGYDHAREDVIIFCADRPLETGLVKGVDVAFKVFEAIKKVNPKIKLWLIGRGTEGYSRSDGSVVGYGHVKSTDYFNRAKYILATSRYDALNLAVLEAIACGVKPIISVGTGASEVIARSFPEFIAKTTVDYVNSYQKYEVMKNEEWLEMKEKCILIIKSYFTQEVFLQNCTKVLELELASIK